MDNPFEYNEGQRQLLLLSCGLMRSLPRGSRAINTRWVRGSRWRNTRIAAFSLRWWCSRVVNAPVDLAVAEQGCVTCHAPGVVVPLHRASRRHVARPSHARVQLASRNPTGAQPPHPYLRATMGAASASSRSSTPGASTPSQLSIAMLCRSLVPIIITTTFGCGEVGRAVVVWSAVGGTQGGVRSNELGFRHRRVMHAASGGRGTPGAAWAVSRAPCAK